MNLLVCGTVEVGRAWVEVGFCEDCFGWATKKSLMLLFGAILSQAETRRCGTRNRDEVVALWLSIGDDAMDAVGCWCLGTVREQHARHVIEPMIRRVGRVLELAFANIKGKIKREHALDMDAHQCPAKLYQGSSYSACSHWFA